jgi:hypothetical protein
MGIKQGTQARMQRRLTKTLSYIGVCMPLKVDHVTILVESVENSMPYYSKLLELIGFSAS